jgi:hypothetical protein
MKGKSEKRGMRLVSLIVGFALLVVLCGVVSAESYVVSGVLECSDTIENIGTVNTDLITNTLYNQNGIVIWQVTPNMDVNKYHLTDLEFYAMLNKNDNKLLILINSSDKSKALRGMIPSLRNEENQALSSNPDPAHHCHEYNSHKTLIYDVLEEVFDELKDKSVIASSASLSSNTIYRSSFTDKIFIFGYYIITTEYNAGWHCFHNWPWGDGNDKCKYNPECYECEYSDGMIEVTFDYSITNPKHYYVYGFIVNDNGEESKYTYNGNLWLHQVNCGSKHDVKYGTTNFPLQIILYGHKTWSKSGQMTWMAIDADSISATGHIHGVGPTTVDKSEQPDVLTSISLQETPLNWPETPEQPNVAITDISASPDHVSPGDTVTITVDTCNNGAYLCNLKWQGYNFEEGETPTLTYLYTVPDDAELGSYDVGAGAWDDCTGTCEGQCCPDGLCSGRHNEGLIRYGVFEVASLSGSLTVTVKNAADNTLPDCGGTIDVVLFDKDYIYIKTESKTYSGGESSVQVQFDNLANEQHFIEVYHIPNSDLKLDEFWGVDEVTVSGSTPKDFVRHTQVAYDVRINGESPYGNEIVVNAGEQVHVDITVKNFEAGASSKNVKVRLILDQDKSSPYDFDETQGPMSISQNGEDDFGFDFYPAEAGTYYFYIVVRGEYNSIYIVVDQHDWYKAIVASLLPDLTLSPSDITLSNPNPAVGETVTITATIHNIGNADTTDVIVQFFDGDPDTGGTQIGNDQTIASVNAGGTGTAQVDWTATPGSHEIYVVVDPYDDISESNENNNEAHINCVVEPGQPNVAITDISASPDLVSPVISAISNGRVTILRKAKPLPLPICIPCLTMQSLGHTMLEPARGMTVLARVKDSAVPMGYALDVIMMD